MSGKGQYWQFFIRSSEISFRIALPLIVLTLLGYFLDKRLETKPIFTLSGLGLSVIITFAILFVETKKLLK